MFSGKKVAVEEEKPQRKIPVYKMANPKGNKNVPKYFN
jgi:hypothetical protein